MILDFVLAACALYILYVDGIHVLALWNVLPVAIGLLVARGTRRGPRTPVAIGPGAGFLAGAVPMSLFWHAAWQFDVWRTASSSSTSALMFLILPIYAIGIGLAGSLLGMVVGLCVQAVRTRRSSPCPMPEQSRA
jgi:hypothetical protein